MRRAALLLIISMISLTVPAASVTGGSEVRPGLFYSEEELGKISFDDELPDSDMEYYGNIDISIITAAPAEPVYIYFGHSGLSVEIPGREGIMFDYGTFSFSESFYHDFIFGLLYYSMSEAYESWRIDQFISEDRTTTRLPLDLSPEAKRGVIEFLSENAEPENRTYLYHYYNDNCATRIRDIYNSAEGGGFRKWTESIDTGKSFRDWSTPYMSPSLFFALFLNYLQGPSIDEPINLYQACFLPDVLEKTIAEYEDGTPELIYQTKTRKPVPEDYTLTIRAAAVGAVAAAAIALTGSGRRNIRRTGDILAAFIYIALGVMSSILAFMMFFTNHDVTYMNANALIISPLVFIPGVLHIVSIWKEKRRAIGLSVSALASIALITMLLQLITPFHQSNAFCYIIALMVYSADILSARFSFRPRPSKR